MSITLGSEKTRALNTFDSHVNLDYLDSLRGSAALYVCISHACMTYMISDKLENYEPALIKHLIRVFYYCIFMHGHYAVDLFIVLSGYCLMLPTARSADGSMPGGVINYIKRRARRILPPYYAALAVSLALIAAVPGMNVSSQFFPNASLPAFTPGVLISHLFLIHNHSSAWDIKIDPPMWSVAVEWQIYFMFPLVLLPVWRRFRGIAVIALACVLGVGCSYLHPNPGGDYAWLVGLFAMGMVEAVVSVGSGFREYRWRDRVNWGKTAAALSAVIVVWNVLQRASWQHVRVLHWIRLETWGGEWPIDLLVGAAATSLLIYLHQCVSAEDLTQRSLLLKMLQAPKVVSLGLFSYSLYLIHAPVLELMDLASRRLHLGSSAAGLFLFALGVPLAVLAAYLFHLAFERPFMTNHMRRAERRLNAMDLASPPLC